MQSAIESGNEKVSRKVIQDHLNVLKDEDIKGQDLSNIIDSLFGKDAMNFMSPEVIDSSDMETLYHRFISPEMTNAIVTKGTPEDLKKYTEWAMEKFYAIPAFRQSISDARNFLEGEGRSLRWDNENQRFNLYETRTGGRADPTSRVRPAGDTSVRRQVAAMNRAFASLKPIIEANGMDFAGTVYTMLDDLNVQVGGGDQTSLFKTMNDALKEMAFSPSTSQGASGRKEKRGAGGQDDIDGGTGQDTLIPDLELEVTPLDFMFESAIRGDDASTVPDPTDRNLLDMIGRAEVAGYNTLFGYTEKKYNVVPTEMTIGEIQELQKKMARELGSSAVGKYQILQSTLGDAVKALGLPKDTVFTRDVQDQIAMWLLNRRGYSEYKSGSKTSSQFLKSLAQEWASVPSTVGGRSFYDGDSMGNKASPAGQELAASL